jgi:hypothetical protein
MRNISSLVRSKTRLIIDARDVEQHVWLDVLASISANMALTSASLLNRTRGNTH